MGTHPYKICLKITGGQFGGRHIDTPKESSTTRPTISRVREALFDILASRVRGARVLDLCAGAGTLGFEALSRGAKHATFVDADQRNVRLIQDNISKLNVSEATSVVRGVLPGALRRIKGTFDIIFCDPPYESDLAEEILKTLSSTPLFAPGAAVIMERDRRSAPLHAQRLSLARRHRIGDSELWFFHPIAKGAKKSGGEDE